jgi:hypothetical protein
VTNNAGVDPLGTTFYPPAESFGNYECYQRIFDKYSLLFKTNPSSDSSSFGVTISKLTPQFRNNKNEAKVV